MMKTIALTIALFVANAEAFSVGVHSQEASLRRTSMKSTRLDYIVDSLREDDGVPISTASLMTGTTTGLQEQASDSLRSQTLPQTDSTSEPKKWELPAHHQYSSNDRRPSQEFLDVELQIGRASICLALALFGTQMGTGHSLPELIMTHAASSN